MLQIYTMLRNRLGWIGRRTGKLALPHFVVELFFLYIPDCHITLYSHGAGLSPLFPVWKSIHVDRLGYYGFSLLESGVTAESCEFSVQVMAVISLFICGCLQECVNAYQLYS